MKRWLTFLIGFSALAASGYALSFLPELPTNGVLSIPPRDILQGASCPVEGNARAERLQILGTHRWSKGVIVLYSALCPVEKRNTLQRVIGHKVVRRVGMQWQVSSSDSYRINTQSKSKEQWVQYSVSKSATQGSDRYVILYGQVLKPKVATVEATFDNGQVLRDNGRDGVFALISTGATGICELRVIGTDNQILQQTDLATPRQFARKDQFHQCLPTTHQI